MKVDSGTINFKGNLLLVSTTITVPSGYKIADWNIGNVKLEGVSPMRISCQGTSCQAVFNRNLLPTTVVAGDAVPLTLKGTFTHGGNAAQIQATDYPRVVR
jgi:hypothetical protein